MTHGEQILISLSLSQRLNARDVFVHEDMDDLETVSLIGGSSNIHKDAWCLPKASHSPEDQPFSFSQHLEE